MATSAQPPPQSSTRRLAYEGDTETVTDGSAKGYFMVAAIVFLGFTCGRGAGLILVDAQEMRSETSAMCASSSRFRVARQKWLHLLGPPRVCGELTVWR